MMISNFDLFHNVYFNGSLVEAGSSRVPMENLGVTLACLMLSRIILWNRHFMFLLRQPTAASNTPTIEGHSRATW